MNRTELASLGKNQILSHINTQLNTQQKSGHHSQILAIENVHFDLAYHPLKHLGFKWVAEATAQLAGQMCLAKSISVRLGLSNRISLEALDEILEGIKIAAEAYECTIDSLDVTSSAKGLIASVSAWGTAYEPFGKSEAKQIICVSGDLGGAYFGFKILEREKEVFLADPNMQPELEKNSYLVHRFLKPEARVDVCQFLLKSSIKPSFSLNIDEGLAAALIQVAQETGLGVQIFEDKIPIDDQTFLAATEFRFSALTAALHGGGDHEMLVCVHQADFEKINDSGLLVPIGYLTEDKARILNLKSGGSTEIVANMQA